MELDPGHCLRVRSLRVVCALWRSRSFMVFLLAVCASECLAVLSSVILRRVSADINLVYFVPSHQRTALLWTSRTLRLSLLGNATSWSGTFLKKGTEWYFGCSDGVFCAAGLKAFCWAALGPCLPVDGLPCGRAFRVTWSYAIDRITTCSMTFHWRNL